MVFLRVHGSSLRMMDKTLLFPLLYLEKQLFSCVAKTAVMAMTILKFFN